MYSYAGDDIMLPFLTKMHQRPQQGQESKNDPNESMLRAVTHRILTDDCVDRWKRFMQNNADEFLSESKESEFSVRTTFIHQEFTSLVESDLDRALQGLEISLKDFVEQCTIMSHTDSKEVLLLTCDSVQES